MAYFYTRKYFLLFLIVFSVSIQTLLSIDDNYFDCKIEEFGIKEGGYGFVMKKNIIEKLISDNNFNLKDYLLLNGCACGVLIALIFMYSKFKGDDFKTYGKSILVSSGIAVGFISLYEICRKIMKDHYAGILGFLENNKKICVDIIKFMNEKLQENGEIAKMTFNLKNILMNRFSHNSDSLELLKFNRELNKVVEYVETVKITTKKYYCSPATTISASNTSLHISKKNDKTETEEIKRKIYSINYLLVNQFSNLIDLYTPKGSVTTFAEKKKDIINNLLVVLDYINMEQ